MINSALNEMGFGLYQLQLFLVAGLGWLADNMWIQAIALTLSWVDYEFQPYKYEMATLALYVGLVIGATFFGYSADVFGRRLSFNVTLFLSGAFGTAIGSANNFVAFCAMAAGVGLGLGGNLPVDGALFLEFLPQKQQWLLTFLSSFWSVGQLISSVAIWGFVSQSKWSCTQELADAGNCNWDTNAGWRYGLFVVGGFTLFMFTIRTIILPIKESPKYLLSQGQDEAAVAVIEHIAKKNKVPCPLSMEKLRDATRHLDDEFSTVPQKFTTREILTRNIRQMNLSHIKPLFSTKTLALNTTLLMTSWALIGLAYPLYNSFLPTYLEGKTDSDTYHTYRDYTIQAVMGIPGSLIAAGLVEMKGRWLGRRGAMAVSTLLTGVFIFLFSSTKEAHATLGFECVVSLTQNAIIILIKLQYTPEAFPGPHRATGDALCSSLNRLFGLLAPIIHAFSGAASGSPTPLYVSGSLLLFCGLSQFFLPIESKCYILNISSKLTY
ncbi:membrane transporter [Wallemia mellicola]|uniref:Membrane transporter n=1 Tax=Wallemia mellicola TaxID=1708541 RepID=A0A4T0UCF4_9BASI|nr:membrane transporter [Wallemia mellicola]TIC75879.1 membrane transporter [Wallemia mellicola]